MPLISQHLAGHGLLLRSPEKVASVRKASFRKAAVVRGPRCAAKSAFLLRRKGKKKNPQRKGRLESLGLNNPDKKSAPTPAKSPHAAARLQRLSTSERRMPARLSSPLRGADGPTPRAGLITAPAACWGAYFHRSTPSELCLAFRELTFLTSLLSQLRFPAHPLLAAAAYPGKKKSGLSGQGAEGVQECSLDTVFNFQLEKSFLESSKM